ncbi:hypothetical protein B0H17DRAFT_1161752 [Mycena rosella]|uniref:Uncharacterized protein n=1 Tax=Mycena rosella TaxID=1033263 RepID=A0AAD7D217_MYCRO|nr:hypothetical protein B0H17DRAFT_1161752 [Mycena rosella]
MSAHKGGKPKPRSAASQCSTLLEDETRCAEVPTHGYPIERCRVHHEQYRTMTKRYKEAQKFVDDTLAGALIPSKEDVLTYTSIPTIMEKARLLKKYVIAIREERTGREIHHNRFFLKVDDGHKMRIKVLAKQMIYAVEIRDALEARALRLHMGNHPAKEWMEDFQTTPLEDEADEGPQPEMDIFAYIRAQHDKLQEQAALNEGDDLISLRLRLAKQRKILTNAWLQYTRRIIFHDPHLCAKSLDKVSVKDFVMDDDFGADDVLRVMEMYKRRLYIGLKWWKDSLTEAIAMRDSAEASAHMGNLENRFKILGGWIYNNTRNTPAPNKVTARVRHRKCYVRLCCNFDELHTFLTFSALMLGSNAPSFCTDSLNFDPPMDSTAFRNHLSLCGVIVTDMVNGYQKLKIPGPVPSILPAKTPGCITWVEVQSRVYIFGAIRNEPDDFTTAFLRELRARPDLFTVVTRSDTDPPLKVESFGEVTDQMRTRQFEAPPQPPWNAPAGRGPWNVMRTAVDVLYGGGQGPYETHAGYLSPGFNNTKGARGRTETSFFYHKHFPVKYFLILDASPTGNVHDLAIQVAWAAFRAKGLVQGNYDKRRYEKASDVLFTQHARERLSFLPDGDYTVANLMYRD